MTVVSAQAAEIRSRSKCETTEHQKHTQSRKDQGHRQSQCGKCPRSSEGRQDASEEQATGWLIHTHRQDSACLSRSQATMRDPAYGIWGVSCLLLTRKDWAVFLRGDPA